MYVYIFFFEKNDKKICRYQVWGSNPRRQCPADLKPAALTTRPTWCEIKLTGFFDFDVFLFIINI